MSTLADWETLVDWEALQRLTAAVPRRAADYTTNLYAGRDQVERWCAAGSLRASTDGNVVLVLRADQDFCRVYHVAATLSVLPAALAMLPAGGYTTDLVGRSDALKPVAAAYAAGGFADHAFLRRMIRSQAPENALDSPRAVPCDDDLATPQDVPAVAAFLGRLLDRFAEQLPNTDELLEAVRAGRLLLVRRDGLIAGMLMFDLKGQLAHLRFWHVDHDARGMGVGRRLMAGFLARCAQARRIILWVIGDNDRSIAICRHHGFSNDGMLDRIMTFRKEQYR